jgi:ribosome maturation protein SDO1
MSIFTPINQVKLTNVSVIRLKKGGKRFELACYKNKVVEYRNKVTKDLDEVLQSRIIFTNVSKGLTAKTSELGQSFGTEDPDKIIAEVKLG